MSELTPRENAILAVELDALVPTFCALCGRPSEEKVCGPCLHGAEGTPFAVASMSGEGYRLAEASDTGKAVASAPEHSWRSIDLVAAAARPSHPRSAECSTQGSEHCSAGRPRA